MDNLGSTNAEGGRYSEEKTDRGWEQIGNSSTEFILGGSHSTISFFYVPNGTGPREIRINAIAQDDSDIDWSNNSLKAILVDTSTLTGPRAAEQTWRGASENNQYRQGRRRHIDQREEGVCTSTGSLPQNPWSMHEHYGRSLIWRCCRIQYKG